MENKEYIEREKDIAYVEEQYRLFKEEEDKLAIVSGCVSSVEGVPVDKDVVRVIRCKNCKHSEKRDINYFCTRNELYVCMSIDIDDDEFAYWVDENAFCSNAEPFSCRFCTHAHYLQGTTKYICHRTGEIVDYSHSCRYVEVDRK